VVIGDSYNLGGNNAENTHRKSLLGIPFRLALALIDEGWILRQDIIWHKTMPMPESVKDRFCRSHEYFFSQRKKITISIIKTRSSPRTLATGTGWKSIETFRTGQRNFTGGARKRRMAGQYVLKGTYGL
jgi:hypothetical protein